MFSEIPLALVTEIAVGFVYLPVGVIIAFRAGMQSQLWLTVRPAEGQLVVVVGLGVAVVLKIPGCTGSLHQLGQPVIGPPIFLGSL